MKQITCAQCGKEIDGGYYNAPGGPHCPDCWEQRKREVRPAAYLQFKGTPWPWVCKDGDVGILGRNKKLGTIVAFVRGTGGDIETETANARLIAASPELLEAAKLAYEDWGTLSYRPETFRALDAAIRKALGNE